MKRLFPFLFLLILAGCTEQKNTSANANPDPAEKIAVNLIAPWSIDFDGEHFFISEKGGTVVKAWGDGQILREDVFISEPLANVAESGLLGFVLKKDFLKSHEAYAYYTYALEGVPVNRIVTLRYDGNSWHEKDILLDGIVSGPVHHGGRLVLSPNGILYATIGDGANPDSAQDINLFNGKIIRLTDDNTFELVSIGHRNSQGLAWDESEVLYASEHGQSGNDEINKIEAGKNYGWPIIEGTELGEGMETPLLTSGTSDTWAPSGITFHKGLLYVAALRGEAILVIDPSAGKLIKKIEGYGRIRDVFSDGESLYFITNNTDGRGKPKEDDDVLYRLK